MKEKATQPQMRNRPFRCLIRMVDQKPWFAQTEDTSNWYDKFLRRS